MKYIIDEKCDGRILREYLRNNLGFSRKQLTELKKRERGILLNGSKVTVRAVLRTGDNLELDTKDKTSSEITPIKGELDIIFEDKDIIVLNKPYGMPTHPSRNHREDTLANILMHYFAEHGKNFVFRAINRLDRDTSGLVLVAKSKLAASKLSKQMKERKINKEYIAFLNGQTPACGTISTYIRRNAHSTMLREVCCEGEGGYLCTTDYKRLYTNGEQSVVNAKPITGRTHQLRVHFAHIGHSIVGDTLYGQVAGFHAGDAMRHLLHAYKLEFAHPLSGEKLSFTAPLPPDIISFAEKNNLIVN